MVGNRRRERSANNTKHPIDHRRSKGAFQYDLWSEPPGPNHNQYLLGKCMQHIRGERADAHMFKQNARAGNRTRVTRMGGLHDAAALHALCRSTRAARV